MSENQEPSISQPTKAEISALELERMKIENTKYKSDHRAAVSDYQLKNKDEAVEEKDSTINSGQTRAEIAEFELAKMQILNNKYVGEDEEIEELENQSKENKIDGKEKKSTEQPKVNLNPDSGNQKEEAKENELANKTKEAQEVKETENKEEAKTEKTKTPEEEAKETELANKTKEAQEEKEARTERAIENLQALYKNKEDLYSQKQKRTGLLFKLKNLIGSETDNSKIDEEYRFIYGEYEEALKEVQDLTGKTEDQVIKDYLSFKENKENSAEEVDKKLDEKVENLDQAEGQLSPEKKTLLERIKSMSTGQKIVAGVIVGGVIVVGAGAGIGLATGMGLMQALGLPSIITYSSYAGYAAGQVINIGGAIGVGGTTLAGLIYGDAAFEGEDKKKKNIDNANESSEKEENNAVSAEEFQSPLQKISLDINASPEERKAFEEGPGLEMLENFIDDRSKELSALWGNLNHDRPDWFEIEQIGGVDSYVAYLRKQETGRDHFGNIRQAAKQMERLCEQAKLEVEAISRKNNDSKIDFIPAEEKTDNGGQENTSYEIGRLIIEAKNISELYDILKENNYSDKDIKQIKDLYDNYEYTSEADLNSELEKIKDERLREKTKELIKSSRLIWEI